MSFAERLANAAAARLGLTVEQREAYRSAVEAAPAAVYTKGGKMRPFDHHGAGLDAARAAGWSE